MQRSLQSLTGERTVVVRRPEDALYRVRIGPVADEQSALRLQSMVRCRGLRQARHHAPWWSLRCSCAAVVPLYWAILIVGLQAHSAALAQPPIIPPAPSIAANSFLLVDADTSKVIVERNSRNPMPPASLTKVMTGFIAAAEIESGRMALDDEVLVSVNAWRTPGSRMFIQEGTTVTVRDLLHGIHRSVWQ